MVVSGDETREMGFRRGMSTLYVKFYFIHMHTHDCITITKIKKVINMFIFAAHGYCHSNLYIIKIFY